MVETFGAQYVSLHVRVSNEAAIHLYKHTLNFTIERTEARYYADAEDAFFMRLNLDDIREQVRERLRSEDVDEGEAAGDFGKKNPDSKDAGDKRKVKVGRALGVGTLVEKDESRH